MLKIAKNLWIVFFLLGCAAGTASNILDVQAGPGGEIIKETRIHDRSLNRQLQFGTISLSTIEDSLKAQVIVRNESKKNIDFEYRFLWYDAAGFELSGGAGWLPMRISGKESLGLRSIAPQAGAVRFKCLIRRPNPLTDGGM